jgi:hypothetical protein
VKSKRSVRRQVFLLTPEEKRTVSFVLIAFLLGIGAKHYRETHAVPRRQIAIAEVAKNAGLPAQKRAEARRRKKSQ